MKKLILLIVILTGLGTIYSQITITHTPVYTTFRNQNLPIHITLDGDVNDVNEVRLFYRERGDIAYNIQIMEDSQLDNSVYDAFIPVSLEAKGLEYYIEAELLDETTYSYPVTQPTLTPVLVQVIDEVISNNFVLLSDMDAIHEGEDFSLSVSIYNIAETIDLSSITVMEGCNDVTSQTIITQNLIVYQAIDLNESTTFQIFALDKEGNEILSPIWDLTVKKRTFTYSLPMNIRGDVTLKSNMNNISYDNDNYQTSESSQNNFNTRFNIRGNYKKFSFKSNILMSSLESSKRQAVNRYNLTLAVPYFDMQFGDSSPYYSNFTLNNKNVRGIGARVLTKFFELQGYWGNTARSIETEVIDSNNDIYDPGTFERNTSAFRMAFGNDEIVKFGLNVVKNKDKVSSLEESDYIISKEEDGEELTLQIVNPKDNIVLSSDFKLSTPQKLFSFGTEVALSAYNSNIYGGAISQESLEEDLDNDIFIDPESIENIFVINKNVEPFSISLANMAYKIYANSYFAGNFLTIDYSRVGSAFRALSSSNLKNDTQTLTINNNMNFHNYIFMDFGFNRISDNLSENLVTTNVFSNYFVNAMFRMKDYPSVRLGYDRGRTSIDENNDVSDEDYSQEYRTEYYTLGLGYDFYRMPCVPFMLNFDYKFGFDKDDLNDSYEINSKSLNGSFDSHWSIIPLHLRVTYNQFTSENEFNFEEGVLIDEWTKKTYGARLSYDFLHKTLRPFVSYKTSSNEYVEESNNYDSKQTSFGVKYNPFKLTSISSSVSMKEYAYDSGDRDYSTFNWYLNIIQKF